MNRSRGAAAAAVALSGVALGTYAFPGVVSTLFGLPARTDAERVYLRGVGSRDAALAIVLALCARERDERGMRATIFASALAGACDFVAVASARGAIPNLFLHATGVLALLALGYGASPEATGP